LRLLWGVPVRPLSPKLILLNAAVKMRDALVLMRDLVTRLAVAVRVKEGRQKLGSSEQKRHADQHAKRTKFAYCPHAEYVG
jgi:hypothetical protein